MFAVFAIAIGLILGTGEATAQTNGEPAKQDNPKQTEQVDKVEKKQTLEEVEKELGVKVDEKRRKYAQGVIIQIDKEAWEHAKKMIIKDLAKIDDPKIKSEYFME
jgi:hypothetical protein